jgi:hypothetical protein
MVERNLQLKDTIIMLMTMVAGVEWLTGFLWLIHHEVDSWEIGALGVFCLCMAFAAGWCRWKSLAIIESYARQLRVKQSLPRKRKRAAHR